MILCSSSCTTANVWIKNAFGGYGSGPPPPPAAGRQWKALRGVGLAGVFLRGAGDRQAVGPRLFELLGEAEVRTGDGEGHQIVFVCVFVGFGDTLRGPVGAAEGVDSAGGVVRGERVDYRADRHGRVVAVQ